MSVSGQGVARLGSFRAAPDDPEDPEEDWRARAACRNEDPELFYPVGDSARFMAQIEEAKQVCALCPVQAECLAFAFATHQTHGVWAGTTPNERIRIQRRRREQAAKNREVTGA